MDWYFAAPIWQEQGDCPNTSSLASGNQNKSVRKQTVIKVIDGRYRRASLNGIFALADASELPLPKRGKVRVQVYCCWFGHRLKTRGPNILVDCATAEVMNDYSGPVISNIGT